MRGGAARPALPPAQDVRITRIGADGDGIGALADGSPVYVPFSLPGETVLARPVARSGEGFAAALERVGEASAERVMPPCPQFGRCGGCALQHWRSDAYGAWKTDLLRAALRRAGYAAEPAPLVTTPPRARRRMDFAVRRVGSGIALGLHEAHGSAIVDVPTCEVLHPTLAALLAPLRDLLHGLPALRREGSAVVNLLDSGPDLLLRLDCAATATDRTRLAAFAAAHGAARITLQHGREAPETGCLLRPPVIAMSGVAVQPPPGGFLQASAAGEAAVVAAVLAGLPERLPPRALVAELYAGCGTLSFALAAQVRVSAFEGDAAALASLRAACNAAGLAGRISAQRRDLARQPLSAKEFAPFAAVVLDPPHSGAVGQIETLAASGVARVIYVSCNPATLARDASVLRAAGYSVLSATPIDQFLWSARLESVTVFAR